MPVRQADISSLLSILALVAGTAIGGLLGALVAIPLAAGLRVLARELVAPAILTHSGPCRISCSSQLSNRVFLTKNLYLPCIMKDMDRSR
jgi:hypothetical protein